MSTIAQLTAQYLQECEIKNLSKSTISAYKAQLARFLQFSQSKGIDDIKALTTSYIREFLSSIYKNDPSNKNKKDRHIIILRPFGKYLHRHGVIGSTHPLMVLEYPKVIRKIPEVLTQREITLMIRCARTKGELVDRVILEMFYSIGCRISELHRIKIKDLNLQEGHVLLLGKGSKERIGLLTESCVNVIKQFINERPTRFSDPETRLLKGLDMAMIRRRIKACAEGAKLDKRVYPHLLRHSFATHLLENGADILYIKELLGHSSVSTTQIYTKVTPKKLFKDHSLLFRD